MWISVTHMFSMASTAPSSLGRQETTSTASSTKSPSEGSCGTATSWEVPSTSQPLLAMWPTLRITLVMCSGGLIYNLNMVKSGLTDC